jgi:tRNA(fMet)-specific endonuclease VapC
MNGRILLDTNIVIAVFSGEESIQRYIEKANEIFIPVIVIGELYFGAYNSMNMERNIEKIDEFVANSTILSCDAYTAKIYGKIKGDLKKKGKPIPENDIWIAALADQYGLLLVTKDSHFKNIDDFSVELL